MDIINKSFNTTGIGGNMTGSTGIKKVMTHKPDIQEIQAEAPQGEQYVTGQNGNSVKDNLIHLENDAKNITGETATNQGGTAASGVGNPCAGQETTTHQSVPQGAQGVNSQPTGLESVDLGDMIKSMKQLKLHMNNGIENSINGMEQLLQGMDTVSGSNTEESSGAKIKKLENLLEDVKNSRKEAATAFENFDLKANDLFNLLAQIMKNMKEMNTGIGRNLL